MWRKWQRKIKCNLILFLRLKGNNHKIALGYALGASVNFYPTFGFGVPAAGAIAAIFRANVAAGLLGDLTFKLLWPGFFILNMKVGRLILGSWRTRHVPNLNIHHLTPKYFLVIGKVFMTGALFNTLILSVILYFTVYIIFKKYRLSLLRRVINWKVEV